MALASVVVTTHDRPRLLPRACASVLAQTLSDFELIVVDDGSMPPAQVDGSDPRVRLVRREVAGGPSAARNEGIEHAQGKWITFLDDDDWLLPEMLERSIELAEESTLPPPVAVWSGLRIESASGEVMKTALPSDLVRGEGRFARGAPPGSSFLPVSTLVAETAIVRDIGGWDESLLTWQQADFFLRLEDVCSVQAMPRVTYVAVDHGGARQHRNDLARAAGITALLEKHPHVWGEDRRRHAWLLASAASSYRRGGAWGAAVRTSLRAVRVAPLRRSGYRQLLGCAMRPRGRAQRVSEETSAAKSPEGTGDSA